MEKILKDMKDLEKVARMPQDVNVFNKYSVCQIVLQDTNARVINTKLQCTIIYDFKLILKLSIEKVTSR